MAWLEGREDAESPFAAALGLRPELLAGYKAFYGALWDEPMLPVRLLELCRLRIAGIHDCCAEAQVEHTKAGLGSDERRALLRGGLPDGLSETERRALEVAAKVPFGIHTIEDDEMAALSQDLGEPGLVALLVALPLFDASCRLRTALEIEPFPVQAEQPAGAKRPLY